MKISIEVYRLGLLDKLIELICCLGFEAYCGVFSLFRNMFGFVVLLPLARAGVCMCLIRSSGLRALNSYHSVPMTRSLLVLEIQTSGRHR